MKSLTKKIVLLVSISSIVTGSMLVVFQLDFIPKDFDLFLAFLLTLWPITLIIAGLIFLWNSFSRRRYLNHYAAVEKSLPLSYPAKLHEVNLDLTFSFGDLSIKPSADDSSVLHYQQFGPMPDPVVESRHIGNTSLVKIHKAKQYFTLSSRIRNSWKLLLSKKVRHRLTLSLQESNLSLDLRELLVGELSLKAGNGFHTIYFPLPRNKFSGKIYSASERLELILPDESFIRVNLINPFCKIDFPQGDLIKNEDGTIITNSKDENYGLIELEIDGPLKQLVIDII